MLVPASGAAGAEWHRDRAGISPRERRPQEALGVVLLSFPLSSGDLRRHPCLLKAF